MIVKHAQESTIYRMAKPGFAGMIARFLLTSDDGCPRYAMRLMEWSPDGHTSYHQHKEEHEMFVLEGQAVVIGYNKEEVELHEGDAIFIAPCEFHQIRNVGSGRLRMICTVPIFAGMDGKVTSPCE